MIKFVIFDLDDTLISEKEYIKSGYKEVAKILSKKYYIDEKELYKSLITIFKENNKLVFNRLLERYNIKYNQDDIKLLIKKYRQHKPTINFYKDVLNTLDELRKKNIKIGIISDGYLETQNAKIEALNAKEMFDKIILTDKLGKEFWKPNPKAFQIVQEEYNLKYDEIAYVGDNPKKDFYIKKYYPVKSFRIIREESIYKNEDYLENIKEDYCIKNLEEILNIIKE